MITKMAYYLFFIAIIINTASVILYAQGKSVYVRKLNETNSQSNIIITAAERDYLKAKKALTVCARINPGNSTMLPIELMAERLQTDVRLVQTKSYEQTIELIKDGKCDIVPIAVPSPNREKYLDFTTPWLSIPYTIAVREGTPYFDDITAVLDRSFCAIKDYSVVEYLRKTYPGIHLEEVADATEGLRRVQKGSVFAMVDLIPMTIATIQSEGLTDIKIATKLEKRAEVATGTRKDEPLLHSLFQKAVDSLTPTERQTALNYMISVRYENGVDYWFISKILGIGMLTLGLLLT